MSTMLGNQAYKAAVKQTWKKLSILRQVILDASRKPRSPEMKELRIDLTRRKKR